MPSRRPLVAGSLLNSAPASESAGPFVKQSPQRSLPYGGWYWDRTSGPLLCERGISVHRRPSESTGFIDDIGKSSRVVQLCSCLSRFILVSYTWLCAVSAGATFHTFF